MTILNKHLKRTISNDSFKVRNVDNGSPKILEGYFIKFNEETEIYQGEWEEIAPTAVLRSLKSEIKALSDHDSSKVLGRTGNNTLKIKVDNIGLYGSIEINENDSEALNLYERVKRDDINQCSFGFIPIEEEVINRNDGTIKIIVTDMEILELSVVTFPAYANTTVKARNKVQFSDQVKNEKLELRRKTFKNDYIERLKEINIKKLEVDYDEVQLQVAEKIKDIYSLEKLEEYRLNTNRSTHPHYGKLTGDILASRKDLYKYRNTAFNEKNGLYRDIMSELYDRSYKPPDFLNIDDELYKEKIKTIRNQKTRLETRQKSHENEHQNATTIKQLEAEELNITKVISEIERLLNEEEKEKEVNKEWETLIKEAKTTNDFDNYLHRYLYQVTGIDITEKHKTRDLLDDSGKPIYAVTIPIGNEDIEEETTPAQEDILVNLRGEVVAFKHPMRNEYNYIKEEKTTQRKLVRGEETMKLNNKEVRRSIDRFVKTRGQERSGLTTTSSGVFIPNELIYNDQVKVRNETDLMALSNVIEVTTKSGEHPIPKRAKAKLLTVAELEANPALAKPEWLPVAWSVETYRGALPISQEAIDDSEVDLSEIVLENAREQKANTTNEKIAEQYKTFTAKEVTDIDSIKKIINIDLPAGLDVSIVASQSFFHELDTLKDSQGRYLLTPDLTSPSGKSMNGMHIEKVEDELLGLKGEKKAFIGDTYRAVLVADRVNIELGWYDYNIYGRLLAAVTRFHAVKADTEAGFFVTWAAV